MTTEELNTIVQAVIAELEKSGVDFDYKADQAKDDDLVFVIRGTAPNYQGVTVTWKGLLDIITAQATQAKNDAVTAKNTANTILTQVQNKGTEITNFVATSKAEIETQKNESVNAVKSVYQSDLNELKGDLNAESTARQTADNTLQQNIDSEASTRAEADTALGARIDSETTTRESEVAELERVNAIQKYEIENLKAKAEGKIYREEIIDGEAYTLDVPSSVSPYAKAQKIGGKSVVWNQLMKEYRIGTIYGITISSNGDGTINIQGTATRTPSYNQLDITDNISFKKDGRKYLITSNLDIPNGIGIDGYDTSSTKDFIFSNSAGSDWKGSIYIKVTEGDVLNISNLSINVIDLTKMFGSGNEPTLEECKKIFSADYYPYDAGTIKSFPVKRVKSLNAEGIEIGSIDVSSFTSDFKSAGSAHDEWNNGKVTKRISSVDLGTLNWIRGGEGYYYANLPSVMARPVGVSIKGNMVSTLPIKSQSTFESVENGLAYFWTSSTESLSKLLFHNTTLADNVAVKAYLNGIMLYYELATPTEETVPEISNFIQVEGGGTLTFESDDAVHMTVPSTDRFVVDLS